MSCGGVRCVELRSRKGKGRGGEGAGKEKNSKERTGREGEGWVECEKNCWGVEELEPANCVRAD